MFGRYQKCYCMNNNHDDNCDNEIIEKSCQNVGSYNDMYNENCNCGFDDEYTSVFQKTQCLHKAMCHINLWIKHLNHKLA